MGLREAGLDWDEVTKQVSAEPTGTVVLGDPSALSPCGANSPGIYTTYHGWNEGESREVLTSKTKFRGAKKLSNYGK